MDQDKQKIDQVLRALASASRSLRLYPQTSPIPRQSVNAVTDVLLDVFANDLESLSLVVAREGFESDGEPIAVGVPGGEELASELRAHGVSEVHFSPSITSDDILKTLMLISRPAEELRERGGFREVMAAEDVHGIAVLEVALAVVDSPVPDESGSNETDGLGVGIDDGLFQELAHDPGRLNAWLGKAAQNDREALQNDMGSLVEFVGPQGFEGLAGTLSAAFSAQTTETRDCLLGLAMKPGPFRDLMGEMFCHQSAGEIASCMLAGAFGRNMLALSTALASLPLDRVDEAVMAQVHAMLPGCGHSDIEGSFLDHMVEVRKRNAPEPSLAASDQTYLAVAEASAIRPNDMEEARHAVEASGAEIDSAGVRTMLTLLDQQTDADQAHECATNLASLVRHLLGGKKVMLGAYVVAELTARSERIDVKKLLSSAVSPEALGGLLDAVLADPSLELHAASILRALDEGAHEPLVSQAVIRKADGINLAEKLLGRRIMEPLNNMAPQAEWYQLKYVVARLAAEGDSHSMATIETLVRTKDAEARREIVAGLVLGDGPHAQKPLGQLVSDSNADVAIAAARALAKSGLPGSGEPIAARILQLDIDSTDFELGRELIQALVLTPDHIADELLARLARRRPLIKRGHFKEVQEIVVAAQRVRAQEIVGK